MKRGFTLIELLVVMAIIAILAAVLFPVLARAKFAAHKSAAAANEKQLISAFTIYQADWDDVIPISLNGPIANIQNWDDNHSPARTDSWVLLTRPYWKSLGIMRDPETPDVNGFFESEPSSDPARLAKNSYVHQNMNSYFGLNYTYLSPMLCGDVTCTQINVTPISSTAVPNPSSTIALAEARDPNTNPHSGVFFSEEPKENGLAFITRPGFIDMAVDWTSAGMVIVPISPCVAGACGGPTGPHKYLLGEYADQTLGEEAAYLDGHCKWLSMQQLNAGTTYDTQAVFTLGDTLTGDAQAKYQWGGVEGP